jgi:hypothetical protein
MKERIRELAKQAGGHGLKMSTMGLSLLGEDAIEKFAQLIVRECCQKLENDGMVEVAMEMKQHFGVEE